jgi:hypothetical protein
MKAAGTNAAPSKPAPSPRAKPKAPAKTSTRQGAAKPAAKASPRRPAPRPEPATRPRAPEHESRGGTDPLTGAVRLAGKVAEVGLKTAGGLLKRLPGR